MQATRHYWVADQPPDVQLVPGNGALAVEVAPSWCQVIDSPSALGADLRSANGSLAVPGLIACALDLRLTCDLRRWRPRLPVASA